MQKYSVLMSVYYKENPEYLKQSIESMLNQSYMCDQFVLVKDGLLNKELDSVIDFYAEKYSDIFTIVALKENIGLGNALDIGITYCRNELIARMDSDDISHPERCKKQIELFEKDTALDIAGTYIDEFQGEITNIKSVRKVPCTHEEIVRFARRRSPFNHPTVMMKKSAVLKCGGYGNSQRKEDLYLFPKMVNENFKAANISESLLYYRLSEDNLKRRKSFTNCKEYIEAIYTNHKLGYSSFSDVCYVVCAQLFMWMAPKKIVKKVTSKFLRG